MESCLYTGMVRHRRFSPRPHAFRYRLFMVYLDLDELDTLFSGRWLWSSSRWAPARFRREDHLGDPARSLKDCVLDCVEEAAGYRPEGPVRLLTHLRYFGFVMNPVSFYYCFSPDGQYVDHVLLEVHNTPWKERHIYVETPPRGRRPGAAMRLDFRKAFHVSPFMEMDMRYHGALNPPGERLLAHLENYRDGERVFDATLTMSRKPINAWNLNTTLLRFPFMTGQVLAAIYYEALKLWWKKIPYVPHPGTTAISKE